MDGLHDDWRDRKLVSCAEGWRARRDEVLGADLAGSSGTGRGRLQADSQTGRRVYAGQVARVKCDTILSAL